MSTPMTEDQAKLLFTKFEEVKQLLKEFTGNDHELCLVAHEAHDKTQACQGAKVMSDMPMVDNLGLLVLACRTVETHLINEQIENTVPEGTKLN